MRILPVLLSLVLSFALCSVCVAHAEDDMSSEDTLDLAIQDLVDACVDMWALEVKQGSMEQRQAVSKALLTSARNMTAWMRKYQEDIAQMDLDTDTKKATTLAYAMLANEAGDIETRAVLRVGNAVANAREAYIFHGFLPNAARFMTSFVLLRLTDEVKMYAPELELSVPVVWPVLFSVLPETEREVFARRFARFRENANTQGVDMRNAAAHMYVDGKRVPMQLPSL